MMRLMLPRIRQLLVLGLGLPVARWLLQFHCIATVTSVTRITGVRLGVIIPHVGSSWRPLVPAVIVKHVRSGPFG